MLRIYSCLRHNERTNELSDADATNFCSRAEGQKGMIYAEPSVRPSNGQRLGAIIKCAGTNKGQPGEDGFNPKYERSS